MTVGVLWFFLMVLWVSLQCVIVDYLIMLTYFCMLTVKLETTVFVYKYSKGLDVPVCASTHSHQKLLGAH